MDSDAVEHALSLLLDDPFFIEAPRSAAFLSYVVSTALNGDGDRLKAYTIAVDVLGKPESFDPLNDPAVRIMASGIRAAIDRYNGKSNAASVVITMEIGSYKPIFTVKQAEPANKTTSFLRED